MGLVRRPAFRTVMVDSALAVPMGALLVVASTGAAMGQPQRSPLDAVGYALLIAASAALSIRRVWPLTSMAVIVGAVSAYFAGGYPYGPVVLPLIVGMYTVAVSQPLKRSATAGLITAGALLVGHIIDAGGATLLPQIAIWLAIGSGLLAAPWTVGTVVRIRRDQDAQAREEEARRRADEERLRIAREVHDVVGHGLSAINMQAGVALHVFDRRPEQARPALEAVKKTSKDALEELRVTLALYRQGPEHEVSTRIPDETGRDDTNAPTRPTPGLYQLPALVESMAETGLHVDLNVEGERNGISAAADLAAYRIVQESLTNVARHADTPTASVHVTYHADKLLLRIVNEGNLASARAAKSVESTGHGITGMRERAAALGGVLEAGPRVHGGFQVQARIPLES